MIFQIGKIIGFEKAGEPFSPEDGGRVLPLQPALPRPYLLRGSEMKLDKDKLTATINQASRIIVEGIVRDLTGRMGLDGEWDQIDKETQSEIRAEWRGIVQKHLGEFGVDLMTQVLKPVQEEIEKGLAAESGSGDS